MGLFDKLRNEFVDIIEYKDNAADILAWRFPRYQDEIKNGAQLIVRPGQNAVLVNEGQIADIFTPGRHVLSTENIPILSTLKGWKHGFNSPFKVDVIFINTADLINLGFGTNPPIGFDDEQYGSIEVRAFGTYSMRVLKSKEFIERFVSTRDVFKTSDLQEQLTSMIIQEFTDALGEANIPALKWASQIKELNEKCLNFIKPQFGDYGLELVSFYLKSINLTEESKKEISDYTRLEKIDLDKLSKFNASTAMRDAAKTPSSGAGEMMGMGMGMAMAGQMANMFGQNNQQQAAPQQAPQMAPPPPPPMAQFHVVLNGQQAGPYDLNILQQYIGQGHITKDTMVWKAGMPAWGAASTVPELAHLFQPTPPPLPPVPPPMP